MSHWPSSLMLVYAGVLGAVVGSFLNVLVYRLPRRLSIVRPGSACPACGAGIRWYDNVPLASWLLLRGRCRACAAAIGVRYPLVEAAAAAIGVLTVYRFGLTWLGAEVALFAWISLVLGVIDLEHQILPDVLTYPSIVLGLGFSLLGGWTTPLGSLLGAAVGAAMPVAVILLYRLVRGEEGMGWGDVKYLAAIGAVFGPHECLWVLVIAAVAGAVVGVVLIAVGRGSGRTALPFGTFLAVAVLVWLYLPAGFRP